MLVISVTVGSYYNVIISWTVYYFGATLSSFGRSELPWTTCKNWWNSPGTDTSASNRYYININ